jgi:hypothetical protein
MAETVQGGDGGVGDIAPGRDAENILPPAGGIAVYGEGFGQALRFFPGPFPVKKAPPACFHILKVLPETGIPGVQPGNGGIPGGNRRPAFPARIFPGKAGGEDENDQKKGKGFSLASFFHGLSLYSAAIASTGQTPAQVPQSVHFSGSIQRRLSFSEIASTGHSLSQEPQLIHSSLTLYAISYLSHYGFYKHTIGYGYWQGEKWPGFQKACQFFEYYSGI